MRPRPAELAADPASGMSPGAGRNEFFNRIDPKQTSPAISIGLRMSEMLGSPSRYTDQ